jgi:outer membrane protein OmpA-like peptidoglycan-associated protein
MRRASSFLAALACAVACFVAAPVRADDVDLRVDARAAPGQTPKLTLVINKDVTSASVELVAGSAKLKQKQGPQAAGGTIEFALPHKAAGVLTWKGSLDIAFADGTTAGMPLTFQTEVLSANFTFGFNKDDLDLNNDKLTFKSERATSRVEIEVYGDDDDLLASSAIDYPEPVPAGQPVAVTWNPKTRAEVLRIRLIAHDEKGAFRSLDSFPFTITIPHDDVVFDSGKSTIRADQEPKLAATIPEIEKATKRYGRAVKAAGVVVRLFIAGHTDTAGPASSNQALSQARAVAIGKWFKAHGVAVSVHARGFGESLLKVETPDDTDNEQNRRVDYDIAVDSPTGSLSGWTAIR